MWPQARPGPRFEIDRMKRIRKVLVDETVQGATTAYRGECGGTFRIPDAIAPAGRSWLGSLRRRCAFCRALPSRF